MESDLKRYRLLVNKLIDKYKVAKAELKESVLEVQNKEDALQRYTNTQATLQTIVEGIQRNAHEKVSSLVTKCLAAVFPDPYEFKILFEKKRGKTEARPVFVRNGLEVDPKNAVGGGVIDVAAFALRLSALLLTRPARRRLLILDEPFRFLSSEYRPAVSGLLERLSAEMNIQMVIVTHSPEFQIGTIVEIGN